jgi:hypothetical protein
MDVQKQVREKEVMTLGGSGAPQTIGTLNGTLNVKLLLDSSAVQDVISLQVLHNFGIEDMELFNVFLLGLC